MPTIKKESLFIKQDEYCFTVKTVFCESGFSLEQKSEIEFLLNKEPATIPTTNLLFKIRQFEYIEHGLRDL